MVRDGMPPQVRRRFVSERDIEHLTGISARTLQADRRQGSERFPSYKVRGRVLYDVEEVQRIIRASRQHALPRLNNSAPGEM